MTTDHAPRRPQLTVLYIAGTYRSGSTLLGSMLGQLPGCTFVGELRALWREWDVDGARCGCGLPLRDCPRWRPVVERVAGRDGGPGVAAVRRWQQATLADQGSWRVVPRAMAPRPVRRAALEGYAAAMALLYREVAAETGARVIVDSSKEPGDAALLRSMHGVTPVFLHLVRDPRGVAFSAEARYDGSTPVGEASPLVPPAHRWRSLRYAANWLLVNAAVEVVLGTARGSERRRLRYEDLVAGDTAGRLADLAAAIGCELPRGVLDDATLRLEPSHSVAGNRNRFETGTVRIELDERWRAGLDRRDSATIAALTAPLRWRYGYRRTAPSR